MVAHELDGGGNDAAVPRKAHGSSAKRELAHTGNAHMFHAVKGNSPEKTRARLIITRSNQDALEGRKRIHFD